MAPGHTRDDGTASLAAAEGQPHWLALYGPGHVPCVAGPFTAQRSMEQVRVVVDRGAELRGRIGPPELLARLGTTAEIDALVPLLDAGGRSWVDARTTKLIVERVASEQDPRNWQPNIDLPLAKDGSFEHGGLPAGTYDVALAGVLPHGFDDGQQLTVPLGRVRLIDGETKQLDRDLQGLIPGRLRGRVLINGEPYSNGNVQVNRATFEWHGGLANSPQARLDMDLDGEGRFQADLIPDTYRLWLPYRTRGTSNVGYWKTRDTATVVAGQDVEFTFRVRRVTARIRILTAQGTPAPWLHVTMQTKGQPRGWTSWTTDRDGWITIVPAPLGPFRLVVTRPAQSQGAKATGTKKETWLDELRVPDKGNVAQFEQRLPEERR